MSNRSTLIIVGVVVALVGTAFGGVFLMFAGVAGLVWIAAPGPVIAEAAVEPSVPFTLEVPASAETARSVFLEFTVDHWLDGSEEVVEGEESSPWRVEGWVEIDGVEFELDLKPGGEGVAGCASDWEEDVDTEASYFWAEVSGDLLLGSIPLGTDGEVRTVTGQLWGSPGTEITALRVFARE